jgi:hypothetical protein
MPSSGMLCRVARVRIEVQTERITIISVARIGELVFLHNFHWLLDFCQFDYGGDIFLRNVRSHRSHTA